MYSTPIDLSFSCLHSVVEASLNTKEDQVEPNSQEHVIYAIEIIITKFSLGGCKTGSSKTF